MPPQASPAVPLIGGLAEIARAYGAVLCDVWGVIHNGQAPHEEACAALARFREMRGPVVLVSNSPRPSSAIPAQLAQIGVREDAWDAIVTSGDATRRLVAEGDFGRRCYHLGPDRDLALFEGMDVERLTDPDAPADFILCTGPYDDETETPADYRPLFRRLVPRGLPMICANPDLVVERGHRLITCAGGLARAYEAEGGTAIYAGKPHAPIYRLAREALAGLDAAPQADWQGVLFIGDGLPTDMPGAMREGMDALFVTAGIHAAEFGNDPARPDQAAIDRVMATAGLAPRYAIARLVWEPQA